MGSVKAQGFALRDDDGAAIASPATSVNKLLFQNDLAEFHPRSTCADPEPSCPPHWIDPTVVDDLLLDAICVVDTQGRFMAIRGACEAIFGYRPQEMIGRVALDFVFPLDRPRTVQARQHVMAGMQPRHFENRFVRKDGRLVHLMWSWSGSADMRVGVARDITDRVESGAGWAQLPSADRTTAWKLLKSPPCLIPPGLSAIPLSAQDYTVMLALSSGEDVRRESIVAALGENYLLYDQRRLNSQILRLRKKVLQAGGRKLPIATLRGHGYRLCVQMDVLP